MGGNDSASDWEQRQGSDWTEYESAFTSSWRAGCERADVIGRRLAKTFEPTSCNPAAPPDDPPDLPPLNPGAAGRIDGFVAGLVWGCGALPGTKRDQCIARGGEK